MTATVNRTDVTGQMIIAGKPVRGSGPTIHGINPAAGEQLEPGFAHGTEPDVEAACAAADEAFAPYRATSSEDRARFLEAIADNIEALGDTLVARACAESGLPQGRITGEVGRTSGQLRLFAGVLRDGGWNGARIDPAQPDRTPLPRADIRQRKVPLDPLRCSARATFPWRSRSPVATPRPRWRRAVPSSSKPTTHTRVLPNWSDGPSRTQSRAPVCRREPSRCSTVPVPSSARHW